MSRRITTELPDITSTQTTVAEETSIGSSSIKVDDASSFSQDDAILLRTRGHELNQVRLIDSISSDTISINEDTKFTLEKDEGITKLNYDQYNVKRDNTTIFTDTLDYSNPRNLVEYRDHSDDASMTKTYEIEWEQSRSNTTQQGVSESEQSTVGFVDISQFKNELDLNVSNITIAKALEYGFQALKNKTYTETELISSSRNSEFNIALEKLHFADRNGDLNIDSRDVIAYEYDASTDHVLYLNHLMTKVQTDRNQRVYFNQQVPRRSNSIYFDIPTTYSVLDKKLHLYEEVQKLYAQNHLLNNTTTNSVKDGITSWNAGGTNVKRDPKTVQNVIEKNKERIKKIVQNQIIQYYSTSTKLRTEYSHLEDSWGDDDNWNETNHVRGGFQVGSSDRRP